MRDQDATIRAQRAKIDDLIAEITLRDENYEALAEMIKRARSEMAEVIEISHELVNSQLQDALDEIAMLKDIIAVKDSEIEVYKNSFTALGQEPPAMAPSAPQHRDRLKGRGFFGHRRG